MCARVVHLITNLSVGGAEMMLYKLLTLTDREKFEPHVIVLTDKGVFGAQIESLGIPVYPVEMQPGKFSLGRLLELRKLMRGIGPDLIQAWMYHGNVVATILNWLGVHVPILWNIRHTPYELKQYKKSTYWVIRLGAWLSGQPRCIIYNSHVSARRHHELGYVSKKSVVIPNGFDLQKFKPAPETRSAFRVSLDLPGSAFLIGLIARYHPMKDHANFLRAAALLAQRCPDVGFILAGRDVDSKNTVLIKLIETLGLEGKVRLLGEVSEISNLIPALNVVSLSSAWGEAFPNIIGEAMACAVPCVVTDIGDSAQIVGNTGLTVPPKDAQALCNAWLKILEMSDQERADLGIAARQRVMGHFYLQNIVSQYEKLYSDTLNAGNSV